MGLKFKVFEMQKLNISTYRAQKVDEKKDVIRLIMFTSKVMVIRISKIAHLMYFLHNTQKTDPVWVRYLKASERSYLALLQILWIMEFCPTINKLSIFKNTGFH